MLTISRWIRSDNEKQIELHSLAGVSTKHMVCVYSIRIINKDDKVDTNLICAKYRIAPVNRCSYLNLNYVPQYYNNKIGK